MYCTGNINMYDKILNNILVNRRKKLCQADLNVQESDNIYMELGLAVRSKQTNFGQSYKPGLDFLVFLIIDITQSQNYQLSVFDYYDAAELLVSLR